MAQLAIPVVKAPFSKEQRDSINAYQKANIFHPFTCGKNSNHSRLQARKFGLKCANCDYTQRWVHEFMADWSWQKVAS